MKIKFALLATALAAVSIGSTQATLLTYEGFDYTASTNITGQDGGTGWRTDASWANASGGITGKVATRGLSYTGINPAYTAFSPTGNAANLEGTFQNDRLLAVDTGAAYDEAHLRANDGLYIGGSTVTGTLWGSFLVQASQWDAAGSQMIFNMDAAGCATSTKASIRQASAGAPITIIDFIGTGQNIGTGSIPTSALSTTNPNLIVFRYEFNEGSDDTLSVWLNPTAESDPADITTTAEDFVLNYVTLHSGNENGDLVFDEIRYGTTFADVVPASKP